MNSRDRRALLSGAAIIGAALAVTFVVLPTARSMSVMRQSIDSERSLLERERDIITQTAAIDSTLRAATARLAARAFHALDGAEPSLATRNLANFIETVASLSGVDSLRSDPIGVENVQEGVVTVRVRVSGTAPYAAAMLFLHRVEQAPLIMQVEQIAINAPAADEPGPVAFSFTAAAPALADQQLLAALRTPDSDDTDEVPPETDLLAVLGRDPFQSAMLGTVQAEPAGSAASAAEIVLVGTVVLPNSGGVVMARAGAEPPRIVRIGDRIGGMLLRGVEPGAAEFEDHDGTRFVVRVPKPGA